ncbi:response regulator transcription factor [Caproiciproducens sp. LBM24188]|nr:helix-turn-helix domain-containing protein [Oscillospiraceae bacterium]HHV32881.1 helix-turn-helix domain-containing protein [Clostridiales bacterium]
MIKLLLADDEPLVLVGLQSMLKWEDYDIEICGTAHNGGEALEMIQRYSPDLVIADIKMPLKSGLEVMKYCRETYGRLPLFILLTSFEEFQLVKEAISYQAVDYLIKLELTPETLAASIAKAVDLLRDLKKSEGVRQAPEERGGMQAFYDRFFVRLLNNLFENREQYRMQRTELGMDFSFEAYAVCYCEVLGINSAGMSDEKLVKLYSSTIRMVRETITKYMACYITSLDMRHFSITFCLSEQEVPTYCDVLKNVLEKTISIVYNYFNVRLICAVGTKVDDPFRLSESFYAARQIFHSVSAQDPILFAERLGETANNTAVFDLSQYKDRLAKAYTELDGNALYTLITEIAESFRDSPARRLQAMDAACSLLYMAISMLPDGEQTVSQIFADDREGFRSIYAKRTTDEILAWILKFRDGLQEVLQNRKQSYKDRIVVEVQGYIRENLNKKLSLNEVAAVFGFSPNYLSQLFTRSAGCNFVEYITQEKIAAAKKMMADGNEKIYEIAEALGFESAFYFSKVFKKVEGCSPREYMKNKL